MRPVVPLRPEEVRREIWHSLISMLHAYASIESLGSCGEVHLREIGEEAVSIERGGTIILLSIDMENGAGEWLLSGARGTFEISGDGTLKIEGADRELDVAAMEWMEKLPRLSHRSGP